MSIEIGTRVSYPLICELHRLKRDAYMLSAHYVCGCDTWVQPHFFRWGYSQPNCRMA